MASKVDHCFKVHAALMLRRLLQAFHGSLKYPEPPETAIRVSRGRVGVVTKQIITTACQGCLEKGCFLGQLRLKLKMLARSSSIKGLCTGEGW